MFRDRKDAGHKLAVRLSDYKGKKDVVVVGLARGGVICAHEIAKELHLSLEVMVIRKLGVPGSEEIALGAVSDKGVVFYNQHLIGLLDIPQDFLSKMVEKEKGLAKKRAALYRGKKGAIAVKNQRIILVDDGIATGATMRVAIRALREEGVQKIILAVPVAAPDSLEDIRKEADEAVCLLEPPFFESVGNFYQHFEQVNDEEILELLS